MSSVPRPHSGISRRVLGDCAHGLHVLRVCTSSRTRPRDLRHRDPHVSAVSRPKVLHQAHGRVQPRGTHGW
ncbi:hypothetical protein QJS66_18905 [Kocuria rhizophila]|nr:hypothetical protein QJS66_18905 [Kocuria rhizophila]